MNLNDICADSKNKSNEILHMGLTAVSWSQIRERAADLYCFILNKFKMSIKS